MKAYQKRLLNLKRELREKVFEFLTDLPQCERNKYEKFYFEPKVNCDNEQDGFWINFELGEKYHLVCKDDLESMEEYFTGEYTCVDERDGKTCIIIGVDLYFYEMMKEF